jgi:hypothetical protein
MWYSTSDNNFHVFDGVADRTLESYALDVNPVSAVILAMNSLATLAFISLVTLVLFGAPGMWYSTSDNNFHVFDGVADRTLESYAQRLTINPHF